MDTIKDFLAKVAKIGKKDGPSDEELAALESEGLALFDAVRDGSIDTDNRVAAAEQVAGAVRKIQDEAAERIDAVLSEQEAIDAIDLDRPEVPDTPETVDVTEAPEEPAEATEDPSGSPEATDTPETPEEPAEAPEAVQEPEPVAAAARRPDLRALRAAQGRQPASARTTPRPQAPARSEAFLIGPDNERVTDLRRADELMRAAHRNHGAPSAGMAKIRVLHRTFDWGEDRFLHAGAPGANRDKVEAIVADAQDPAMWVDGSGDMLPLTAAGQFCAPAEPYYDQPVLGETYRPLRDSLPSTGMERGTVAVTTTPVLSDIVVDDTNGAIDTLDPSASTSTKTIQSFVTCPASPTETSLEATTIRMKFGNFNNMTWAERDAAYVQLAMVSAARHREQRLIAKMDALCTALTETLTLGAMPDILLHLRQILVSERLRLRLNPDARMRVVLPQELIAMMQADVARQLPGDGLTRYQVTEAFVRSALSELGANLTVLQDDNVPGVQATGTLNGFQTSQAVRVFPEGTFMFGGGQELNLGVVRDSANNEDNTYETFEEAFETLFRVGGWPAYKITFTVCVTGGTAATIDSSSDCEAS